MPTFSPIMPKTSREIRGKRTSFLKFPPWLAGGRPGRAIRARSRTTPPVGIVPRAVASRCGLDPGAIARAGLVEGRGPRPGVSGGLVARIASRATTLKSLFLATDGVGYAGHVARQHTRKVMHDNVSRRGEIERTAIRDVGGCPRGGERRSRWEGSVRSLSS